jgi:hypothetical protein
MAKFRLSHDDYVGGCRGFQMTFDNGNTVSVQWGAGNSCANRSDDLGYSKSNLDSPDAEIAAWDSDDNWYEFENGPVDGRCTPNEVAAFIQFVATNSITGANHDQAGSDETSSGEGEDETLE